MDADYEAALRVRETPEEAAESALDGFLIDLSVMAVRAINLSEELHVPSSVRRTLQRLASTIGFNADEIDMARKS